MPGRSKRPKSRASRTPHLSYEERQWEMHRERIAQARPMVDCRAPVEARKPMGAMISRLRQEQDQLDRIQRENFVIFKVRSWIIISVNVLYE